jgi:hypothetical protein
MAEIAVMFPVRKPLEKSTPRGKVPISQRKWCDDISMGLWKRLPRMPRHANSSKKWLRRGGNGGENRNNDASSASSTTPVAKKPKTK